MPQQRILINGRFLTQPTTGVQRVAREVTREIDRYVADNPGTIDLSLICRPDADLSDLQLRATDVLRVEGSGHKWEQLVLPRYINGARLLCLGNTAPLGPLMSRRPVAVMIHDLSYRIFPDAYTRNYRIAHGMLLPFLLRRANPIFTVSETEREMLASLVPSARRRIVVAQNGGWRDDHAEKTRLSRQRGGRYLLYVGSFSQRKNFDGVLAAAVRLAKEDGVRTVLTGSVGSFLRPTDFEIPPEVSHLIEFTGQIEDLDQLAELYRGAACLLFPSFYEASPLPPLEAMSMGCPTVVSNIPSMRERCGDGALYVEPNDVDGTVSSVRRLLNDPAIARNYIGRGYAQAARFSWRAQAETIVQAMLQVPNADSEDGTAAG